MIAIPARSLRARFGLALVALVAAFAFASSVRAADAAPGAVPGLIEIELAGGGRVRISGAADAAMVTAALRALVP